jgi:hypothetical protein
MASFDAKGMRDQRFKRRARGNCLAELRNLRHRLRIEARLLSPLERQELQSEIVGMVRDLSPDAPTQAS